MTKAWKRHADRHWYLGPPKTKRARRTVSLPDDLVAVLLPLVAGKAPDELLFTNTVGAQLRRAVSEVVHQDHDETAKTPTPGCLPFAPSSDVITLHEGPLQLKVDGGLSSERPGKIALVIRSGSNLLWGADLDEAPYEERRRWRYRTARPQTSLRLPFHGAMLELDTNLSGGGAAFFGSPSTSGQDSTPLVDVIAHWVDLPSLPRGEVLCLEDADGSWIEWGGRWVLAFGDWEAIIDGRPDLTCGTFSPSSSTGGVTPPSSRLSGSSRRRQSPLASPGS